ARESRGRASPPSRNLRPGVVAPAKPAFERSTLARPATLAAAPVTPADEPTALRGSLRRLARLQWGMAAAALLLTIVASAIFAPSIAPHDPLAVNIRQRLAPPVWMDGGTPRHLPGPDQSGRSEARPVGKAG